jgi:phosphoribulokinase
MTLKYPIISVTGSSGAGTTSVKETFDRIFEREGIFATSIEGDAFHRYDRVDMKTVMQEEADKGNNHFSHFGPEANRLEDLESVFKQFSEDGSGRIRNYVHDATEAKLRDTPAGQFTDWRDIPEQTEILFYEGLHGAVVTDEVNVAQYCDLKIGVVPVINLEWIQKIQRDKAERGYSTAAIRDTMLRRMPDYISYICPQFSETDINFQRIPTVDTSNAFVARYIPTADESMVVIRFKNPRGIDFPYLVSMIDGSFMSRANTIVIPGGKLAIAMQLILTPMILRLMERRRRAR